MRVAGAGDLDSLRKAADIVSVVGSYVRLRQSGSDEWVGLCPFHTERTPSFTVTRSKGLFHCFGCKASGDVIGFLQKIEGIGFQEAVARLAEMVGRPVPAAARDQVRTRSRSASRVVPEPEREREEEAGPVSAEQRVTAVYRYTDANGELLFEVLRLEPGRNGRGKEFKQRRRHPIDGLWVWGIKAGLYRRGQDGWYPVRDEPREDDDELPEVERVLYRLPEVLRAETVYVVEGEKDADTLAGHGLVATTNAGGATQKWLPQYSEALRGKRVVVLPDQDEPGRKRGAAIAAALAGIASGVVVVHVPEGKDVSDYLAGHSIEELHHLVDAAWRELRAAELERRGLLSPVEVLELYEGGVTAFLEQHERRKGVPTGFARLDAMTSGLHPGEVFILAARPAMGKTSLALNIAEHAASRGYGVAIFSLEMSRDQILTRLVCARARVNQAKFRAGKLDKDERRMMMRALTEISEMPIYIDDAPACSLKSMREKLDALRKRGRLGLVVVDYLQLMRAPSRENRNLEVGAMSRGMKVMARELRVPFLVLSQLSRAPESRPGNHRPQLSDLRDSGEIEQDADVVAFIYREEIYRPDREELRNLAELIVAKQRNGPTGVIKLVFLPDCTRFENRLENV